MKTVLITGSGGLIGYELAKYYLAQGWDVMGIDNDERGKIFGKDGSGNEKILKLEEEYGYTHFPVDITTEPIIYTNRKVDAVIHCAAQPSHDQSGKDPLRDFQINALGTVHVLEWARKNCPEAPFVHLSSSKVYGDLVNQMALRETESRYDFDTCMGEWDGNDFNAHGVSESLSIDQSMHSPYGASKASSDIMAQEYARYYGMPVTVIRPTNMTGPSHSSIEAHGFLHYLVRCAVEHKEFKIYGYKGKQVRDNIHSDDVVSFIAALIENPRSAEIYNLGSGKENARSILELISLIEEITGEKMITSYVDQPRRGDHIVYYTDIRKARRDYPNWDIRWPIRKTVEDMVKAAQAKLQPA